MEYGVGVRQVREKYYASLLVDQITPFRHLPDPLPHELLQLIRALSVRCRLVVVPPAVIENEPRILDEILGQGV